MIIILLSIGTVKNLNAQFSGGFGTEIEPYLIQNIGDLQELHDSIMSSPVFPANNNWSKGKYFILMNDITDSLREPIGFGTISGPVHMRTQLYPFQGNFDGNNYKITLAINNHMANGIQPECGLFSMISNAKISNLTVDGYIIYNTNPNFARIGSIVGWARDTFEILNCTSYVNINAVHIVGGIVAFCYYSTGKIENCVNYGNLSTSSSVGGIALSLASVSGVHEILNCKNFGKLIGASVGGIVNSSEGSHIISNCENHGELLSTGVAGGIAASAMGAKILNCGNYNNVTGNIAGGIAGNVFRATSVSDCINLSNIGGISGVGGIIGMISFDNSSIQPSVTDNTNYGFVKGDSNVGGIMGGINNISGATVTNNFNSGVVVGTSNVGCIVGSKGTGTNNISNNHYDKQMCGEE